MRVLLISLLLIPLLSNGIGQEGESDKIIGKWITAARNSLIVEVYKCGTEYKAKIVWFNDRDNKSRPMNTRLDIYNPDKTLTHRKLLGLEVMNGLKYNKTVDEWQSGKIYDVTKGKIWDVKVSLGQDNILCVRGYWHFPAFGKTMTFKRL